MTVVADTMSTVRVLAALLLLSGCTSTEPPSPMPSAERPAEPSAEPARDGEPETSSAAAIEQTLPFSWTSPRPAGKSEVFSPMPTHVDNGPTRVEAWARPSGGVQIEQTRHGKTQWTASLGEPHTNAAALAWAGDVFVASYSQISSGATLARLKGENGTVVWQVPVEGLGPVEHSKYSNDVQLSVAAGEVWVYGREAQGSYVERHDWETGALREHSLVDTAALEVQWQDPPTRSRDVEEHWLLPDSWSVERRDDESLWLVHTPARGNAVSFAMPNDFGRCNVGVGLVHGLTLYIVHACSMTAGAQLYALTSRKDTHTWSWQVSLTGLGPVAHSAYANRVGLRWHDGRVVVDGDESMGRYLEVVDPDSGKTLVTRRYAPSR